MKIYRVVNVDGSLIGHIGRGSDPFTNKAAAKRRATQLNNEARTYYKTTEDWYKVQEAEPTWKDLNE